MNVKAILIDIDNTIIDFNASADKAMNDAFEAFGLRRPSELFSTFKRINDGLWRRIEEKTLTVAKLHEIRWGLVFKEFNIDFDGKIMERRFFENLFNCAIPVAGAEEALRYLSAKYPVYAASNAFYEQQKNRLKISGLAPYITDSFVSEITGYSKPDSRFFEYCFKHMPYKPEETVMIGDSLSADIEGAKRFGLITCWYNPTGMRIAAPDADFIAYRLTDLKNMF